MFCSAPSIATNWKSVSTVIVMSRLFYCNSVLIVLPIHRTHRLQSDQNTAALLICKLKCFDHVTDALVSLHWLHIPELIVYKIEMSTFKVYKGLHQNIWDLSFVLLIYLVDRLFVVPVPIVWWCHLTNFQLLAVEM